MTCDPLSYVTPHDEGEVVSFIQGVAKDSKSREKIKVIGSGLSFSGVQLVQEGHMMSMEKMNSIISVQYLLNGGALVQVQSGMVIRDFAEALAKMEHPQAMINI